MKIYSYVLILTFMGFGSYSYGQYRCELTSQMISDDSLGEYAACLEPDSLEGMVIHVPSNLTRLNRNGDSCPIQFN